MLAWIGVLAPVLIAVDTVQAYRQRRSPSMLLFVSTAAIAVAGVGVFVAGMASFDADAQRVWVLWLLTAGIIVVAAAGYIAARWIERRALPDEDA